MSKQIFLHQADLNLFDAYMDRVAFVRTPENEEEELITCDFLIFFIKDVFVRRELITANLSSIKEMEGDIEKHPYTLRLTHLVSMICNERNLMHPSEKSDGMDNTFQSWFETTCKKYGRKPDYNYKIMSRLKKVKNPQYPV